MRERAHLAGGWLTAGPDGEQFRVTASSRTGCTPRPAEQPPAEREAGAAVAVESVEPLDGATGRGATGAAALEAAPREAAEPEGAQREAAVRG